MNESQAGVNCTWSFGELAAPTCRATPTASLIFPSSAVHRLTTCTEPMVSRCHHGLRGALLQQVLHGWFAGYGYATFTHNRLRKSAAPGIAPLATGATNDIAVILRPHARDSASIDQAKPNIAFKYSLAFFNTTAFTLPQGWGRAPRAPQSKVDTWLELI